MLLRWVTVILFQERGISLVNLNKGNEEDLNLFIHSFMEMILIYRGHIHKWTLRHLMRPSCAGVGDVPSGWSKLLDKNQRNEASSCTISCVPVLCTRDSTCSWVTGRSSYIAC